jgi:3'-5' exoribonuclease
MNTLPRIAELGPEVAGAGYFLCSAIEIRRGRGGDFAALTLQDSTGQLAARILDNLDMLRREFEAGEFVRVQGRTQLHNGRLQLIIERIRRVGPSDYQSGFRDEDCVASAPRPIDEMWSELEQVIAGVRDPHIRLLLEHIAGRHASELRVWPAAVSVHHAYRGGLLEHVLQVAQTARALARAYGADEDVVTAGALLHDIGKLRELDYEVATTYSRDGNLIGHITIGVLMVHDACAAIAGFPDERRAHIEHLVVSHHGNREYGSPIEPMTVEAFILAAADDLDAKLHQVRRATAGDQTDGEFTSHHPRFGRVLWKNAGAAAAAVR